MKKCSTSAIYLVGTTLVRNGVSELLERLGVPTPICMISAGWQESEGALLPSPPTLRDLKLHQRAAKLFGEATDLSAEHSAKQRDLMRHQAAYNLRLTHAVAALDSVRQAHSRTGMESLVWHQHESDAMTALRALDRQHVRNTRRVQGDFAERWSAATLPALRAQRDAVAAIVNDSAIVLVAGGHIAVLFNRLRLFAVAPMLAGKTIVAWGAGAMAMSDQVMLYDDRGPLGSRVPEVLDDGLGMIPKTVLLPGAVRRLDLGDAMALRTLAARAAPRHCIALGDHAELTVELAVPVLSGSMSNGPVRNGAGPTGPGQSSPVQTNSEATPGSTTHQGLLIQPQQGLASGQLRGQHAHRITPSGRLRRVST